MKSKNVERIFLLALIALGCILFYGSSTVRVSFKEPITAKLYGQALSSILIIVSIIRLAMLSLTKTDNDRKINILNVKLVLLSSLFMIMYTFGISSLGYFVTTYIYMLAMIIILTDDRSKKALIKNAFGTLVFTVVLYFIFDAFNVFLPNAWLI